MRSRHVRACRVATHPQPDIRREAIRDISTICCCTFSRITCSAGADNGTASAICTCGGTPSEPACALSNTKRPGAPADAHVSRTTCSLPFPAHRHMQGGSQYVLMACRSPKAAICWRRPHAPSSTATRCSVTSFTRADRASAFAASASQLATPSCKTACSWYHVPASMKNGSESESTVACNSTVTRSGCCSGPSVAPSERQSRKRCTLDRWAAAKSLAGCTFEQQP